MDGIDITMPAGKEEKTQEANITSYHSKTDQGIMTVQLEKKRCIDSMPGIENNYTVKVLVNQKPGKAYQEFNGYGNYIADLRLRPRQEPK